MKYTVKTPASTLAVSLADVKDHLRETTSDLDSLITSYIQSSQKSFEQKSNTMLTEQTWTLYLSSDEVREYICFYKYPVTAISTIKYYDSDNALQTMDSGNYTSIFTLRPSEIIITDLPSVYPRSDAMQIEFVGSFSDIPSDIILALKQRCYKVYNNPDDFVEERLTYFEKVVRDYRSYEE